MCAYYYSRTVVDMVINLKPCQYRTTGKKIYYTRPPDADKNQKFTLLATSSKDIFRHTQIPCAEYDGLTDIQEREIFQVNRLILHRQI